ncbi:MAG TPA: serine hydrolase [Steroidobacter sp.]
MNRREALVALSGSALLAGRPAWAQSSASIDVQLDALVEPFLREFEIPGACIGVVTPDRPAIVRGYGVRTLGQSARVDARTSFAIASNSKAYLAACLALLVDEGKLRWDDPVLKHLPEFKMYDAAVTSMMTVCDLLVHRSGLPLGAGDLMQFPRTDHTAEEILRALPHFKPATGFRAGYAYDNCLYIVAGILLERVSGLDWNKFVAQRLFEPLRMTDAVTNVTLVRTENRAGRHGRLGPPVRGMGKVDVVAASEGPVVGPAGGINMSVADSIAWLKVQLDRGALPDGRRLWSEAQAAEMWTPRTLIASGPGPTAELPQQSVMQGYALGWGVSDYRGHRMLSHAGGLAGQVTRTALLPERGIGLVVYTNSEENDAVSGLRYALIDHLLGAPAFDWPNFSRQTKLRTEAQVREVIGDGDFKIPPGAASLSLPGYAGRYRDPWYGDVVVRYEAEQLHIDFTRTVAFRSKLEAFGPDAFRTRFARGAGEDAVVTFLVEGDRAVGMVMKALSPLADFSFDFHDLRFSRIAP